MKSCTFYFSPPISWGAFKGTVENSACLIAFCSLGENGNVIIRSKDYNSRRDMTLFFLPYIMFCYSAGYALTQTLDGLGFISTNLIERDSGGQLLSSYWSPGEVAVTLGSLIALFILFLLPLTLMSAWLLARRKGLLICCLLILTPGLLSVLHLLPPLQWAPRIYDIGGTGATGNAVGMGSFVFLGLISGWIFTLFSSDIFSTGEKFRQWTDILLILTALTSGVFWVSDREAQKNRVSSEDTLAEINGAAQYLLSQVKEYSHICRDKQLSEQASCQWASYVQEQLQRIASTRSSMVKYDIPETLPGFYAVYTRGAETVRYQDIRKELQEYNHQLCPTQKVSSEVTLISLPSNACQAPPPAYCTALQKGEFATRMGDRTAVANECVLSSILRYRDILLSEEARSAFSKDEPHYRWMWFIVLAFGLGVKVANIMTKLCNVDGRPVSERMRIKYFLFCLSHLTCLLFKRATFFSKVASKRLIKIAQRKRTDNTY